MDKLMKELRSNLLVNPDVSILKNERWQLPVVSYEVSYSQVKRFKMDILMKMLLLAFQETDIRRAATLAEMLMVEELFIRDLIEKMERTDLIGVEKTGYKLTAKGHEYLEKGIFEEDMEEGRTLISYSAVHDAYRSAAGNESEESKEMLSPYRYAAEGAVDWDRLHELLLEESLGAEESFQIVVTDIINCEESGTEFVPCIEFQLYDRKQDVFYARVWNGMTGSWDETLEKQIEEKEIVGWREAYIPQNK
ncbi:hypothetical protein [Planomicrobium sp. CPCC 101079]|uniref:hypothetical protein n=1 Tax=Planomicrobium sp. CPCC 101079 TaxID=2599618 RepID=UPI0011B38E7F|nr:hypothetical protein [Planomicrobium sp. CPCC 101079]TWT01532.1 hypothetical protein FQV28_15785 [Planomicrobium sp. CPCC 101079]